MTKEIIEKIANSYTPLQTNDLSVEDKKALYAVSAKKGFYACYFSPSILSERLFGMGDRRYKRVQASIFTIV